MDMAIAAGDASDPEGLAWCLARSGWLAWKLGRLDDSERRNREALFLFPDCSYAYEGLGRTAAARGDLAEAGQMYERAFSVVPWPQYAVERYEVAIAQGSAPDAVRWKSLIGALERLSTSAGLFNRVLAGFEADYGSPDAAVRMARGELEGRKDVYGWDTYAWALHRSGREAEASQAESHAVALGTQDPLLDFHAAAIFADAGDRGRALRHARRAHAENPNFDLARAREANDLLERLSFPAAEASR
jgi:tetratricopeptide (TPR) repeat protein